MADPKDPRLENVKPPQKPQPNPPPLGVIDTTGTAVQDPPPPAPPVATPPTRPHPTSHPGHFLPPTFDEEDKGAAWAGSAAVAGAVVGGPVGAAIGAGLGWLASKFFRKA